MNEKVDICAACLNRTQKSYEGKLCSSCFIDGQRSEITKLKESLQKEETAKKRYMKEKDENFHQYYRYKAAFELLLDEFKRKG